MMKNTNQTIKSIILILIAAIVFGCDKSESNSAPELASSPSPADNSENIEISIDLQWQCTDIDGDKISYDIYFGTNENPEIIASGITTNSYPIDNLEFNTSYYWKINSIDDEGNETEGSTWSFQTKFEDCGEITNRVPEDNFKNIETETELSWICEDPDGDPLTYDIYFGKSIVPELLAENVNQNSFNPGSLEANETYFWKIIARDQDGNQSESEIFKFSTGNIIDYEFELGNSGTMISMVWINAGEFMMGAQSNEIGAMGDEYPRHRVSIPDGFWLGKYEITQQQWEAIAGSWTFYFDGNPQRPAETVSWNHVHSLFLDRLNSLGPEILWRLPSEAEWEYACRAGHDDTRFWWGNDPGYTLINNYAWCWQNNGHQTHDVGLKSPNPWGLYDMNGNVWEWCEDQYHNGYSGAPDDGSVWGTSSTNGRVARGGGWGEYGAQFCRSSARGRDNAAYGYSIFGFRLVREEN